MKPSSLLSCSMAAVSFAVLWTNLARVSSADAQEAAEVRGKLLLNQDFRRADGIAEWRSDKGKWTVEEGALKGMQIEAEHHPAGLSCPLEYHDARIEFRFQFPEGGRYATLLLRSHSGNLCRLAISQTLILIQRDKPNLPKDSPERIVVLDKLPVNLKHGAWYNASVTIHGMELSVEIEGVGTLKGSHPALDVAKTEVEFLASGDAVLYTDLRVWEMVSPKISSK